MVNHKKTVLFDYDGVLVDSMPFNLEVVSSVLEKMGYREFPTVEFCREAECISFEAWAKKIGVPDSKIPEYISGIHQGVIFGSQNLAIFEGIADFLDAISRHFNLGVITASASEAASNFLKYHGVREHFLYVLGGET